MITITPAYRQQIANEIAALEPGSAPSALVGFDGFVDSIIDAVATRSAPGPEGYEPMASLRDLGNHIAAAAGRSCNVELVVRQAKIGGNAAIMANALAALDHGVRFVGNVGDGAVHPAFAPLAERALEVITLGPPAMTDAVECADGKVMFGKTSALDAITAAGLRAMVGDDRVATLFKYSPVISTVNWTMTHGMTGIWRYLVDAVLPGLRDDRPRWFVDLSDPAKRTREDLEAALATLRDLQGFADVCLSLNQMEATQVLALSDEAYPDTAVELDNAAGAAGRLRELLGLDRVVVHTIPSGAVAGPDGVAGSIGFSTPTPFITTGGGDHFNAGFLAGLTRGFDDEGAICVGNAVSGFYVRNGTSPSWGQIRDFLLSWSD